MTADAPSAYLSVDMEGCATLVHWDEVRPSPSREYHRACAIMTDETNAVIDGIVAGGGRRVVVNDSHSRMRNLIAERLREPATLLTGTSKPQFMLEGIDSDFDAAFFVGYHGGVGDRDAVLGHTYSPHIIYECRLNGEPVDELAINAALAGHYGVPVVFVSGDRTTIESARRRLPWVTCVVTKQSLSSYAALSESPSRTRTLLAAGAQQALRECGRAEPYRLRAPIAMEIDTRLTAHADVVELVPGCERRGPRTLRFVADEMPAIYRALVASIYLGSAVAA